ncbi:hypothetical protein Mapa_014414 [Marchantia paleacea]|nr:hypothetical protein Mapa_014414 [Marchantia paleacea]
MTTGSGRGAYCFVETEIEVTLNFPEMEEFHLQKGYYRPTSLSRARHRCLSPRHVQTDQAQLCLRSSAQD